MTEKLYEQDSMLKSCLATVLSCAEDKRGYAVVLDRTVFFPEGGGQLSDRGTLGGVKMTYAAQRGSEVVHYCERPLPVGEQVEAVLDWQARLDHMQQHAGEHILSHAVWKLFGANNIGFHMGERLVTIDLDKELTAAELAQAEDYANSQIWEDKPITVSYLPHTELPALVMRKKNEKLTGTLRIVTVADGDICTCCGTHPLRTGMIGLIRINRFDKHKDGIRVEFLCGRWALEDARRKNEYVWQAGRLLSMKPEGVPQGLRKLQEEVTELNERLKAQSAKLYEFLAPQLLAQAAVADELRAGIEKLGLEADVRVPLSISVGVSFYPVDGTDDAVLLYKADKALYEAKKRGKNNCVIYSKELENEPFMSQITAAESE